MSIFDEYKGFWGTGAELTERAKSLSKSMGVKAEKVTERLIRYYTAEGVLDKPDRLGRDAAYHFRHLIQLLTARRLADEGVPLAVISDFNLNKSTEELAEALLKPPKEEAVAVSEQYRGKLMESKEKEKPNLDSEPVVLEDVLNEIKNIKQALSNEAVQLQKMKYEIEEMFKNITEAQYEFNRQMENEKKEMRSIMMMNLERLTVMSEQNNAIFQEQLYMLNKQISTDREELMMLISKQYEQQKLTK